MNSTAPIPNHSASCGLPEQGLAQRRGVLLGGLAAVLAAGLAGCGSAPKPSTSGAAQPVNPLRLPESSRDAMMAQVMFMLNAPYKYGGASPEEGFDCSGLVYYALGQVGHSSLPRSSAQWASRSIEISRDELRRGDFVFFNTSGARYSHMGIYVSNGDFVHAPSSGKVVSMASMSSGYFSQRFIEARTVFA